MTSRRMYRQSSPEDIQKRSVFIQRNFNEIAHNYDLFNDIITFGMHRYWKRCTVRTVIPKGVKKCRILDLCCGSGDLTLALADCLSNGSEITAIDFSPHMLTRLKKKLKKRKINRINIAIKEADVTRLETFTDNSIDGVVMGFGLRNIPERELCLREIQRVLKSGATMAILDVGHVTIKPFNLIHKFYFETIVPLIGHLLQGEKHEMYDYLPASARTFPDQNSLKLELERLDFKKVKYRNFLLGAAVLYRAQK